MRFTAILLTAIAAASSGVQAAPSGNLANRQTQVDFGAVDQLKSTASSARNAINELAAQIDSATGGIVAGLSGNAVGALQQNLARFDEGITTINEGLEGMVAVLQQITDTFEGTEQTQVDIFS